MMDVILFLIILALEVWGVNLLIGRFVVEVVIRADSALDKRTGLWVIVGLIVFAMVCCALCITYFLTVVF